VEVVVEGIWKVGAHEVRAFENEGNLGCLGSDVSEVADVGEIAAQEPGGLKRLGGELNLVFEAGPFGEFLFATFDFDSAAEIVG
jgi:hypothetical protein